MISNFKKADIGQIILDLPPNIDKKNSRNSEGAFLRLANGDIIFMYSHFCCGSSDNASSNIALLRSLDNGLSWLNEGIKIRCTDDGAANIISPSLLQMNDGGIAVFYLIQKNYRLMRVFIRRSYDFGKTWTQPEICSAPSDYYAVNNDRVIRLSSGRIIIPAADHRITSFDDGSYSRDSRAEVIFCISDDDGISWKMTNHRISLPCMSVNPAGLQEPGIIELQNGILWGWARTNLGVQYEFHSHDSGMTWTTPAPSRFTSPCSSMSMKRIGGGNIISVYNPIPEYNGRSDSAIHFTGGRTPLAVSVSTDDGKTFSPPAAIEDDSARGYCYCAIYELDDAVLLAYCAGGPADGSILAKTRIRRILKNELLCS